MDLEEPSLGALTGDGKDCGVPGLIVMGFVRVFRVNLRVNQIRWKPFKMSCVARRKITGRPCGQVVGEEVVKSRSMSQRIFSGASGMLTLIAA